MKSIRLTYQRQTWAIAVKRRTQIETVRREPAEEEPQDISGAERLSRDDDGPARSRDGGAALGRAAIVRVAGAGPLRGQESLARLGERIARFLRWRDRGWSQKGGAATHGFRAPASTPLRPNVALVMPRS